MTVLHNGLQTESENEYIVFEGLDLIDTNVVGITHIYSTTHSANATLNAPDAFVIPIPSKYYTIKNINTTNSIELTSYVIAPASKINLDLTGESVLNVFPHIMLEDGDILLNEQTDRLVFEHEQLTDTPDPIVGHKYSATADFDLFPFIELEDNTYLSTEANEPLIYNQEQHHVIANNTVIYNNNNVEFNVNNPVNIDVLSSTGSIDANVTFSEALPDITITLDEALLYKNCESSITSSTSNVILNNDNIIVEHNISNINISNFRGIELENNEYLTSENNDLIQIESNSNIIKSDASVHIHSTAPFAHTSTASLVDSNQLSIKTIYKVNHIFITEESVVDIEYDARFPEESQYSQLMDGMQIATEDGLILTIESNEVIINMFDVDGARTSSVNMIADGIRGTHPNSDMNDCKAYVTGIMNDEQSFTFSSSEISEGHYVDTKGHISHSIIQDNRNYQQYSYEIESTINLIDYEQTVKQLVHPSGFLMIGKMNIDVAESAIPLFNSTGIPQFDREIYPESRFNAANDWLQIDIPDADTWTSDYPGDISTDNHVVINREGLADPDCNISLTVDLISSSHLQYSKDILLTEDGFELSFEQDDDNINPNDMIVGTANVESLSTSKLLGNLIANNDPSLTIDLISSSHLQYSKDILLTEDGPNDMIVGTANVESLSTSKLLGNLIDNNDPTLTVDLISSSHLQYSKDILLTEDGFELSFEQDDDNINPNDMIVGTANVESLSTSKLLGNLIDNNDPTCNIHHAELDTISRIAEIPHTVLHGNVSIDEDLIIRRHKVLSTNSNEHIKLTGGNVNDKYVRILH
jgi:hypothetical protein